MLKPFKVVEVTNKNKHAEVFLYENLTEQFKAFESALVFQALRHYNRFTRVVNSRVIKNYNATISLPADFFKSFRDRKLPKFTRNIMKIVKKWYTLCLRGGRTKIKSELGVILNFTTNSARFKAMILHATSLITSVAEADISKVEAIIHDSSLKSMSLSTVAGSLSKQITLPAKKLKLLARDQTAKANASLNQIAQEEAGVDFFMWRTARDERVSTGKGGHKQLDGKIYKWGEADSYPEIDEKGTRGLPHERVNCRCEALAVIPIEDFKQRKNPDGSYTLKTTSGKTIGI